MPKDTETNRTASAHRDGKAKARLGASAPQSADCSGVYAVIAGAAHPGPMPRAADGSDRDRFGNLTIEGDRLKGQLAGWHECLIALRDLAEKRQLKPDAFEPLLTEIGAMHDELDPAAEPPAADPSIADSQAPADEVWPGGLDLSRLHRALVGVIGSIGGIQYLAEAGNQFEREFLDPPMAILLAWRDRVGTSRDLVRAQMREASE